MYESKVTRREIAVSLFKPNVNSGVGDGSVMMIISPVQIPYECADIWMLADGASPVLVEGIGILFQKPSHPLGF